MKVEVIKRFRDKHTNDLHEVKENLTISKERYQEINGTALGVFVKEIKENKPTKKTAKK